MADITDPVITKYMAEQVRPMAEDLRNMQAELSDMVDRWNNVISPALSGNAGADVVKDNVAGGVEATKDDLTTWVSNAMAVLAGLQDGAVSAVAGRRNVLEEFVVRPLKVS